jgi:dTDP-4-amino-4,6-dideoxygalactose transaminase
MNINPRDFPVAEYIARRGMHFGIHQYLSFEDLDYVADVLSHYFENVVVE